MSPANPGPALSLEAYLNQVGTKHQGVVGSREQAGGAAEQAVEGDIITAPSLFANANLTRDSSLPSLPLFTYDRLITNTYSFGVADTFSFGLQARLEYDILYLNYVNAVIPQIPGLSAGGSYPLNWNQTTPKLSLSQPLWGGGFGRAVQANQQLIEAQALATQFGAQYQARTALASAEATYWQLALARQSVEVTNDALGRAQKILAWNTRRARLGLGDQADVLQSQALVETRRLDYQTAIDDERTSSLALNSSRGIDADVVPETLQRPDPDLVAHLSPPTRAEMRDDVKAAREQTRATDASSAIAVERDQPTLNVFGSYALNGRATDLGPSLGDPFSANRPTETIGVNFQMPLDIGTTSQAREGWARQRAGADLVYQRKLFEQEETWKDLTSRLSEARHRLTLAVSIEQAQLTKLSYERVRLERGRTTTYQVLLFEQDYALAQIGRIHAEGDVLNLLAQMKLFSESA